MSISFEDAVNTLAAMFPDWDRETLSAVLVSNHYHVERTIETVLSMASDTPVNDNNNSNANNESNSNSDGNNTQTVPQSILPPPDMLTPSPSSSSSSSAVPVPQREGEKKESEAHAAPSRAQAYRERHQHRQSHSHSRTHTERANYRGTRCELPANFLRIPGYLTGFGSPQMISDEELALMLQSEIFQREARAALGEDFDRAFSRPHGTQPHAQRPVTTSTMRRDSSRPTSQSVFSQQQQDSGDLGIVKSLSSMGSAAKRNLVLFAQRFSSGQRQGSAQAATGEYSRETEAGTAREFKPLVDGNDEDDEDNGVEIISFDSGAASRSRHVLQANGREEEEFSSSNPLIQSSSYPKNL